MPNELLGKKITDEEKHWREEDFLHDMMSQGFRLFSRKIDIEYIKQQLTPFAKIVVAEYIKFFQQFL